MKPESIVKGQIIGLWIVSFGTLSSGVMLFIFQKTLWYIAVSIILSLIFLAFNLIELYQKYITLKEQSNFPEIEEEDKGALDFMEDKKNEPK